MKREPPPGPPPRGCGAWIDDAHRGEHRDRRVEQQHPLQAQRPLARVELGDEGGMGRAQGVAGEMEAGDLDPARHLGIGRLHDPAEVGGIVIEPADDAGRGGVDDEAGMGGVGQRDDVVAAGVQDLDQLAAEVGKRAAAGASDHEHQRRRAGLLGDRKLQPVPLVEEHRGHRPVDQAGEAVAAQGAVELQPRHRQCMGGGRADHGRDQRVDEGEVVGVEAHGLRRCGDQKPGEQAEPGRGGAPPANTAHAHGHPQRERPWPPRSVRRDRGRTGWTTSAAAHPGSRSARPARPAPQCCRG
jgi:hypothetical protein